MSPGERVLASGSVQLPRFTLLESGSLLVSPAHLPDAGTYTCLATNSRGVDEASADLVVWGKGLPEGQGREGPCPAPAPTPGAVGCSSLGMGAGFCGCKRGLSLPVPPPRCQWVIVSPLSKDAYHGPAAGPERHQRHQGCHELRGHP